MTSTSDLVRRRRAGGDPASHTSTSSPDRRPTSLAALQGTAGNAAVGRMIRSEITRRLVRRAGREGSPCSCGGTCSASRARSGEAPPIVREVLNEPGAPLDPSIRDEFGSRFRYDFGDVRVHDGKRASDSAAAIDAVAYTVSPHIVLGAGAYRPSTAEGRSVLAHELTHVVQQEGTPSAVQALRLDDPSGDSFELEAIRNAAGISTPGGPGHRSAGGPPTLRRQMKIEEPAAGCGICQGPMKAGRDAHTIIQMQFALDYPLIPYEPGAAGPPGATGGEPPGFLPYDEFTIPGSKLRPDLILPTPTGVKIGEIKPAHEAGYAAGKAKINAYIATFQAAFPEKVFEPLNLPIAPELGPFPNPMTPQCYQELFVNPPIDGVYGYWCEPSYSQLVGRPNCRCSSGEPDTLVVPSEAPEKRKEGEKEKDKREQQKPAPVGGLEPVYAFIARLIESGADVEEATEKFLADHPELVNLIIGTAAASMVATIVEDLFTAGVGLIDDPIILGICYRVIQVARAVKAGTLIPATVP